MDDDSDLSTSFFKGETDDSGRSAAASEPLYKGAPLDVTVHITNLLLFKFNQKHSLTQIAFQELLYLLKALLPADAALPTSVKDLKASLVEEHGSERPTLQEYCSVCLSLGSACSCAGEGKRIKQFVTVPLGPQIKARLEGIKCNYRHYFQPLSPSHTILKSNVV